MNSWTTPWSARFRAETLNVWPHAYVDCLHWSCCSVSAWHLLACYVRQGCISLMNVHCLVILLIHVLSAASTSELNSCQDRAFLSMAGAIYCGEGITEVYCLGPVLL